MEKDAILRGMQQFNNEHGKTYFKVDEVAAYNGIEGGVGTDVGDDVGVGAVDVNGGN
jgi:hypothetical protein